MLRRRRLYEGKNKILYRGTEPGTLIQHFKDEARTLRNEKKIVEGKGVINNRISEYLFVQMNQIGIANHFIRRLNMREQVVREMEMIPLEVVLRNVVSGEMAERLGLENGIPLPRPIVEFHYKSDSIGDSLVNEDHILAFGWAGTHDIDDMLSMAMRSNDFLSGLFIGIGFRLIDFRLEFGRVYENDMARILIGDEISPDQFHLWDMRNHPEGCEVGNLSGQSEIDAVFYHEIAHRLGVLSEVETVLEAHDITGIQTLPMPTPIRRMRPRAAWDSEAPRG